MTTNRDAKRSANAKRQGRKRQANGSEGFGEIERVQAVNVKLPNAEVGSKPTFSTVKDGLMNMSGEDYKALCDSDSRDVIDLLEVQEVRSSDLPGPDHPELDGIARNVAATSNGLSELDYEGSTGSWGTRQNGEGAVSFHATTWEEAGQNDRYEPSYAVNEQEIDGTMTFEEFADGYFPYYDGENISLTVDIDFKRLSEEFGDGGGQYGYLHVLQEGANYREDELHYRELSELLKERTPPEQYSTFASPRGRLFLSSVVKHMQNNPELDASSRAWASDTAQDIHDGSWMTRIHAQPRFDELPESDRDEMLNQANLLQETVSTELNSRAKRRETSI